MKRGDFQWHWGMVRPALEEIPPAVVIDGPLPHEGRPVPAAVTALTRRCCRWPIADPRDDDFRFCGARLAADEAGPYCEVHRRQAHEKAPPHARRRPLPKPPIARSGFWA